MRAIEFITENIDADFRTASMLAKEMYQDIEDFQNAVASGSSISGGHSHNRESLKQSILELEQEIKDLGFVYDPKSPGLVRKAAGRV
jgi:cell division protein FtsB